MLFQRDPAVLSACLRGVDLCMQEISKNKLSVSSLSLYKMQRIGKARNS